MLWILLDFLFLGCFLVVVVFVIVIFLILMFGVGLGFRFGGFVGGDWLIIF